ncbi:MAG: GNAT family N-acetyltransferase [Bacteroidetes bacterium]|nr:GNAT family N-acetyltransferase [Bacteroidota bacterium]
MGYLIKNMTVDDLDFAAKCTAGEGWITETMEDFENFLAFDPSGCFIAEHNNKQAGICIATSYGENGFIGELIVSPGHRGNGIGTALICEAIDYLKENGALSIYLDGDLPAVPMYEKLGFKKICKSLRFTGRVTGRPHINIQTVTEKDLAEIFKLDVALFGAERTYFLERKFKNHPTLCKVVRVDNKIKGYLFAKNNSSVISVGPWVVLDRKINPISMIEVLAYELGNVNFRIGVLESNSVAAKLLRSLEKMNEGDYSIRMVLGENSLLGMNESIYGLGSPAKG